MGNIAGDVDNSPFLSYGPVWRWDAILGIGFVEFGFSPTYVGESRFSNERDLGGNFHFTSDVTLGTHFGRRDSVEFALRIQHISNGGLEEINPGLDLVGISMVLHTI